MHKLRQRPHDPCSRTVAIIEKDGYLNSQESFLRISLRQNRGSSGRCYMSYRLVRISNYSVSPDHWISLLPLIKTGDRLCRNLDDKDFADTVNSRPCMTLFKVSCKNGKFRFARSQILFTKEEALPTPTQVNTNSTVVSIFMQICVDFFLTIVSWLLYWYNCPIWHNSIP